MKLNVLNDEIPNRTEVMKVTTRTVLLADCNGDVFAWLQRTDLDRQDDGWDAFIVNHNGVEATVAYSASYERAIAEAYEERPTRVCRDLGYTSRPMLHRVIHSDSLRLSGSGEWRD